MRRFFSTVVVALTFFVPPTFADTAPVSKEKLHIYLLIGQSNMAGRAALEDGDDQPIARCFLFNSEDEWEVATNPLNRYSTIRKGLGMQKIGPGFGFARAMTKADAGIFLGLIVNAKGGSKIEQWEKGTKFYDDALKRTQAAMNSGTLKGILWHQGESNEKNPDGYSAKLKTLIEDLRKDLEQPDLPFVVGQVNNVLAINDQLSALPSKVDATGCVSSEGLKCTDRWHFDRASAILLGERYAAEMQKLLK